MKPTLVTALALAAFSFGNAPVHAQKPVSKGQPRPLQIGETCQIDHQATHLPKGFRPHLFVDLYDHLERRRAKLSKDEFETQAKYQERLTNAGPLIAPVAVGQSFCFLSAPRNNPAVGMESHYDPEAQSLSIRWTSVRLGTFDEAEDPYFFDVLSQLAPVKRYRASNAFGAQTEVTQLSFNALAIRRTGSLPGVSYSQASAAHYEFEIKAVVPPEEAKRVKESIALLIIASLDSPLARTYSFTLSPTMDYPVERKYVRHSLELKIHRVLLIDRASGRIYTALDAL